MKKQRKIYIDRLDIDLAQYALLGIKTSNEIYKLAHFINKEHNINLERKQEITIENYNCVSSSVKPTTQNNLFETNEKEEDVINFPVCYCYNPNNDLSYFLIENTVNNSYYIKSKFKYDYILILYGNNVGCYIENVIVDIRRVPKIDLICNIAEIPIKQMEYLEEQLLFIQDEKK